MNYISLQLVQREPVCQNKNHFPNVLVYRVIVWQCNPQVHRYFIRQSVQFSVSCDAIYTRREKALWNTHARVKVLKRKVQSPPGFWLLHILWLAESFFCWHVLLCCCSQLLLWFIKKLFGHHWCASKHTVIHNYSCVHNIAAQMCSSAEMNCWKE